MDELRSDELAMISFFYSCVPSRREPIYRRSKRKHHHSSERRSRAMAMAPPKPKMGVDPARSRDIMDDMVNVVRIGRAPVPAPPRPRRFEMRECKRSPSATAADKIPPPPHAQVETYVADGFDSFEECLTQELPQDDETEAALKAGLDVMYRAAQERIDEHFGRFAEHASSTCFAVPKELLQAQDLAENLPSCSVEEERALDDQLRALRKRLAHANAMRTHCDAQCDALQVEMADHAHVVTQLRLGKENAVLGGVKGGKRGVETAAAAVVAAARQLAPLLEQAEEMQRRGLAFSDAAGVAPFGDPAVGAKNALREHFAKGATLEVLKAINSRLNARKATLVAGVESFN
jgi:hypothetical protein